MAKEQLEVVEFGRQLIETGDLDPVYIALWEAGLDRNELKQWLLSYWCFYHMGTASWVLDESNYWRAMQTAAGSSDFPRGTERRHFRAKIALNSVAFLEENDDVLDDFDRAAYEQRVLSLGEVMDYVQLWNGFGPWIAFKVADMLERLDLVRVNFKASDTFLFDSPKKGAELVQERYNLGGNKEDAPLKAFDYILNELGGMNAPPRYERLINGQEVETILCKWKSHMNGKYQVGHDVEEVKAGLMKFPRCRTSQRLYKALLKGLK